MNIREDDVVSAVALRHGLRRRDRGGRRRGRRRLRDEAPRRRRRPGNARRLQRAERPGDRSRKSMPQSRTAPGTSPDALVHCCTRERRWSVSVVPVLAGPWRWPAARRGWLDPTSGIQPGHRRQTCRDMVPPAQFKVCRLIQSQYRKGAASWSAPFRRSSPRVAVCAPRRSKTFPPAGDG